MRLPLWIYRLLHRQQMSRSRLKGGWLHAQLGDGVLHKSLWRPTRGSLARSWLVSFPITMVPLLPGQTIFAAVAAFAVRGNILLAIAVQFLSNPFTAPVHLPACYFVGELLRGHRPGDVFRQAWETPRDLFSGSAAVSLYLGAVVLGLFGGLAGYVLISRYWPEPKAKPAAPPASPDI